MKKLKGRLEEERKRINETPEKNYLGKAFIVFSTQKEMHKVVQTLSMSLFRKVISFLLVIFIDCRYVNRNYFDKKRISVEKAPGPTEINWGNLHISHKSRLCRVLFSYFMASICLGFSLAINIQIGMWRKDGSGLNFGLNLLATIVTITINLILKPIIMLVS